jgi:acylphosphatase
VQGVGFRYFLARHAQARGLSGWVRNRADGGVELVAEGDRSHLDELLEAARQGPRHSRVDSVDAQWSEAMGGLDRFDLSY